MSIRLLNGVELVQSPISACMTCRGNLSPRKLEALYLPNPEQKSATSAYLLTDLWYCHRCDKGFVLAAFRQVTDSHNRKWIIKELSKPERALSQQGSNTTSAKSTASTGATTDLKVKSIDFILQDHESKCPNCKVILTKMSIQLQMVKGKQVEYTPCSALNCQSCHKWMLRRHHYIALQANFQPFIIQLSQTAKRQPAAQSPKKNRRQNGITQSSTKAGTHNHQFNQYGVFLPSPTGRKGYFDE